MSPGDRLDTKTTDLDIHQKWLVIPLLQRFAVKHKMRQASFSIGDEGGDELFVEEQASLDIVVLVIWIVLITLATLMMKEPSGTIHDNSEFLRIAMAPNRC